MQAVMGIRKSKTPQLEAVQCEYWNTFSDVSQFHPPKNILNTGFNNKHNSKLSLQPSQVVILIHCFHTRVTCVKPNFRQTDKRLFDYTRCG